MRAWIASKGVRRTEPEYELRDALGQSGCAVCRLAIRTAARQLDILSYENVNDVELRAKLRDARGFCNRHAWQLLEQTRDPLGVALIYKDVVNTLVPHLRPDNVFDRLAARLRGLPSNPLASRLASHRECPVCLAERETEDVYLRLLGARIAEPAFRESWVASSGLCWPHLLGALSRARSDEALDLLVQSPHPSWPARPPVEAEPSEGAHEVQASLDQNDTPPEEHPKPEGVPPPAEPAPGPALQEGQAKSGDAESARTEGDSEGEGHAETDPFPLPESRPRPRGVDSALASRIPLGASQGTADQSGDVAMTLRALALSHGRWSADRSFLPPDLVVDLQQRRLEAVTRPAGDSRPECHACQEAGEGMERRLAGALAEGISGEELGGICERHAWQLARRRIGELNVPLALLGGQRREALAVALERARTERPAVVPPGQTATGLVGGRAASALRSTDGCPLCSAEAALDREVMASAIGMRRPVALCRIHLSIAAMRAGPRPHWSDLLAHQAGRWRQLSNALAEFIRKHDYRFSQETRGEERDSPWRAVEEIARSKGSAVGEIEEQSMRCPCCGHENLEGEQYCASCQQRLPRPSAEIYDAMYRAQDEKWRARRRRDVIHGLVWGLAVGLVTLAIGLSTEATGGDPTLIALGKQTFWLVGLLWGLAMWGFRRISSSER